MLLLATASMLGLILAAPAIAQTGAGMSPGTPQSAPGMAAPHHPNNADRLFVQQATIGGKAEVELGRLAEQKGRSEPVKQFARQMVADHGKANQQLGQLAQAANVPQPGQLDPEHRAMRSELDKLDGAQFDLAYIRGQVSDHQVTAQLLEWEIGSGQDPQLKAFAAEILPVVLRHLEMASSIQHQLAATATGMTAPGEPPATSGGRSTR